MQTGTKPLFSVEHRGGFSKSFVMQVYSHVNHRVTADFDFFGLRTTITVLYSWGAHTGTPSAPFQGEYLLDGTHIMVSL